ncbi:hypothetical protein B0T19DRAFT_488769 [Cercophora scortea]|uniref:Uncharacterized protein n=1 Tax=Cercophora scortea TaxID=314031 RepID=A0AAE0I321_9PEZI|nr:hypothetical protein B0T19DRAFT_488769 [Cercophora scortea]
MASSDEWQRKSRWKGKERDDSPYVLPASTSTASTNTFTFPSSFTNPTTATNTSSHVHVGPPSTPRFPGYCSPLPASSSTSSSSSSISSSSSTTAGSSSYPLRTGSNSHSSYFYSSLTDTQSIPASRNTNAGTISLHTSMSSRYTPSPSNNSNTKTDRLSDRWSPLISDGYAYYAPSPASTRSFAYRYSSRTVSALFDRMDDGYTCHRWTNFDRGLDDNDVKMDEDDPDDPDEEAEARRRAKRKRHGTF